MFVCLCAALTLYSHQARTVVVGEKKKIYPRLQLWSWRTEKLSNLKPQNLSLVTELGPSEPRTSLHSRSVTAATPPALLTCRITSLGLILSMRHAIGLSSFVSQNTSTFSKQHHSQCCYPASHLFSDLIYLNLSLMWDWYSLWILWF